MSRVLEEIKHTFTVCQHGYEDISQNFTNKVNWEILAIYSHPSRVFLVACNMPNNQKKHLPYVKQNQMLHDYILSDTTNPWLPKYGHPNHPNHPTPTPAGYVMPSWRRSPRGFVFRLVSISGPKLILPKSSNLNLRNSSCLGVLCLIFLN